MRADRLLSIMLLLQIHRRITARELAKRLEVSERTIYRDIEALSASGVPVSAERGTGGGIILPEAFRTNLTGLNSTEIQALFLGRPVHLLNDLGLHQASEAALIKLQAVLPALSRSNAEYVRQRIHVDVAGWQRPGEERLAFLPLLQEALWQERKVCLGYQREDKLVERVVDPLGLVAKGRIWYLVAAVESEARTYRISRIQRASITEEACTRPPGFDLASYWQRASADFVANIPRYIVSVRMQQSALPRILHAGRFIQVEQITPPDGDGWVAARITFEIKDEACGYLLSFGAAIEILEPQELREQVITTARNLLAFYAQREIIESSAGLACEHDGSC
ncbi:MAG TPA: YafY family protein [Ktedonobacteraceae bacterium]|nr:YafY family protein [Ktedonobacteraceae bacterium]